MRPTGINIDRSLIEHIPGGFLAFGAGADIDQAFDSAVTMERFELGTNGVVPSLADVDPTAPRTVHNDVVHPHQAVASLLEEAVAAAPGTVLAQAVAPLTSYKHERRRLLLDSIEHSYPARPGLILPLAAALRAEIDAALLPAERSLFVGAELATLPRRRFKVSAQPVRGPRQTRYAVLEGERVVEIHPSQSLARKAAIARAKAAVDVLELHVRPFVGRNEGEPFVVVRRHLVSQRATVKVVLATPKNPERVRVLGWVFAGRTAG
jgi:hypothetical protein